MTFYYEEEFMTPCELQTNSGYLYAGGAENPIAAQQMRRYLGSSDLSPQI